MRPTYQACRTAWARTDSTELDRTGQDETFFVLQTRVCDCVCVVCKLHWTHYGSWQSNGWGQPRSPLLQTTAFLGSVAPPDRSAQSKCTGAPLRPPLHPQNMEPSGGCASLRLCGALISRRISVQNRVKSTVQYVEMQWKGKRHHPILLIKGMGPRLR